MTIHKGVRPTHPPSPSACGNIAEGVSELNAAETANGTLSPVGLLCNGILSAVNGLGDCPAETAAQIASHVSGILAMASESREEAQGMRDRIEKLKSKLRKKTVELTQLRRRQFGESSEKSPAGEEDTDLDAALIDLAPAEAVREKPKGKRALRTSEAVKVIRKDHYPENRLCCTCGCEQKFIRSWDSKETMIVPEHVVMINHVYYQGVCGKQVCKETGPNCQQASRHIMKRKKLSLETVLTFAAQKHYEHSTNTRAGRRIRNQGIGHADSTLNRSAIHVAAALAPIQEAMFDYVKAGEVVHADETPIRVQRQGAAKQKGKGRCDRFYIYAFLRDERKWNPDARPVVAFQARPSRSSATINELLSGTAIRHLQIDGYAGYNDCFKADGRNHAMLPVRCWAHTRRKFEELSDSPLSRRFVILIKGMYVVEKAAAYLPFAERAALRQERTLPIVTEIERLLQEHKEAAQGKLKAAINYTLNSFEALQRFIFDGRLEIDNNPVERCIRGIALTRKNSLFAGSAGSAEAWATYFTLIETAKLNDVDPHAYLQWAAGEIERNQGDVDYAMLMPWHCPTGRNRV